MGRKVSPISIRIGISKKWKSNWFASKGYTNFLHEDLKLRQLIFRELKEAGIAEVIIERSSNLVNITIYTSRPGVVIGRSGAGIDELKAKLQRITKNTIKIDIEEVKDPELSAQLVASSIAAQLEKRISYRRACKQALDRVMKAGALGVKIRVAGRLGGVEIARVETFSLGRMPLSTFRSNIDYAYVPARTTYGVIGIKVWIYKGEVFKENK